MIKTHVGKSYIALDGALIFTLLPFRNLQTSIIASDLEAIIPREQWGNNHHAFCFVIGATLDVQCADDTNPIAQAVADYWEAVKSATTAEKWALYPHYITDEVDMLWWEAYRETRYKPPSAPQILQDGEPTDPNADRSGGMPTTANS